MLNIQILLILAVLITNVLAFKLRMQTLYITSGVQDSIITTMLNSYGIPFDAVTLPVTSVYLENENGALYNSIVIEGADSTNYSDELKTQIETYQQKYKVKVVYIDSEPDTSKGFNTAEAVQTIDSVYLTSEGISMAESIQMKGKNIFFDVPTTITNKAMITTVYKHYLPSVTDTSLVQIMKYNNTEAACAGAIYEQNDISSMYFFFPFVDSIASYFASHIWINWSNNGIINGYRRIFLGVQVDDYFADNVINQLLNEDRSYRTSIEDMKGLAEWQKSLIERMPKGSFYKTELAYNSIPILVAAEHKQYEIRNWNLTAQEDAYIKPLNEIGDQRWSGKEDTDWDPNELTKDPLYNYFAKNPEAQQEFFWLTHTFSHENLDYASKFDVQNEIGLNIKMANSNYLDMYEKDWFSKNSIVCPEISGLHNGHCLEAFHEYNVYYGVGDTSRADITNLTNPYIPMMTTMETSNFEGFMVIPRQPTQVYWDIDTIEGTEKYYNNFYSTNLSWSDILDREALHVTKLFLQLRHDPFMFHEGNLRNADFPVITINGATGHFGLLQQWVERIVQEITKYVDWPIITKKMDDLAQTYIQRMDRIKCNPEYQMIIDDSTFAIQSIDIVSSGACEVPLFVTGSEKVDTSSAVGLTEEQVGNDPTTVWIKLDGTEKSIKFNGEAFWSNGASSGSIWNNQNIENIDESALGITPPETNTQDTPTNTIPNLIASITYPAKGQEPPVDIILPANVDIPTTGLPSYVHVSHTTENSDADLNSVFGDPNNPPVLRWNWGWDEVRGYWETWNWESKAAFKKEEPEQPKQSKSEPKKDDSMKEEDNSLKNIFKKSIKKLISIF